MRQERVGTTCAPLLAAWWAPYPTLWALLQLSLPLWNRLNLKTTLYMWPPGLFCDEAAEKHIIHNTGLKTSRIGVETLPETLSVALSPPSTPYRSPSWWRDSSLSLNYGIAEVTCINLFYCASLIRVTWAAYYDCDNICIIPMVDLLLLKWFMRCKLIVVLDVLIDVYVTLFMYALFWSN
jgi:hypothetical protein